MSPVTFNSIGSKARSLGQLLKCEDPECDENDCFCPAGFNFRFMSLSVVASTIVDMVMGVQLEKINVGYSSEAF